MYIDVNVGNTGRQTTTEQNIPTVSRQTFSFVSITHSNPNNKM
jgi:hypothetical protein